MESSDDAVFALVKDNNVKAVKKGFGKRGTLSIESLRQLDSTRGRTPLLTACADGKSAMVEALLEAGANCNEVSKSGEHALFLATQGGNVDIVKTLLKRGATPNALFPLDDASPLNVACERNDVTLARLLLKAGAAANNRTKAGEFPLQQATEKGDEKLVSLLLKFGALPDQQKGNSGLTPLMLAASVGNLPVVKALLSHQASVHLCENERGATALMLALEKGASVEVVSELLNKGAQDTAMHDGFSPLMMAAKQGREEELSLMAKRKFAASSVSKSGWTALHYAVSRASVNMINILLKRGADPNLASPEGDIPLIVCLQCRCNRGALDLLEAGANPCAVSEKTGQPAIEIACMNDMTTVIDVLFERGADVFQKNSAGKSVGELLLPKTASKQVQAVLKECERLRKIREKQEAKEAARKAKKEGKTLRGSKAEKKSEEKKPEEKKPEEKKSSSTQDANATPLKNVSSSAEQVSNQAAKSPSSSDPYGTARSSQNGKKEKAPLDQRYQTLRDAGLLQSRGLGKFKVAYDKQKKKEELETASNSNVPSAIPEANSNIPDPAVVVSSTAPPIVAETAAQVKFCGHCGVKLEFRFCSSCGMDAEAVVVAPSAPVITPSTNVESVLQQSAGFDGSAGASYFISPVHVNDSGGVAIDVHAKDDFEASVVLVGRSGLGKSTLANVLVNHLTERDCPFLVGHDASSRTAEFQSHKTTIGQKVLHVVDTPGFDHTDLDRTDVVFAVCDALHASSSSLRRVLFVSSGRLTPADAALFNLIARALRADRKHITLVRTRFRPFEDADMCRKDVDEIRIQNDEMATLINNNVGRVVHVDCVLGDSKTEIARNVLLQDIQASFAEPLLPLPEYQALLAQLN